ncbi:hypothetical protein B0T21DRAFT_363784 [Apiosordaria backusii]|uniref:Uncharacterized protein n=1 Tax=Apiosordaria backusii TaxID=314023 RepID=A0AA40EFU1_9PEZI|nr:hypothetical protein B0T21DRAFT_363784 [Apiosordaria backusii]
MRDCVSSSIRHLPYVIFHTSSSICHLPYVFFHTSSSMKLLNHAFLPCVFLTHALSPAVFGLDCLLCLLDCVPLRPSCVAVLTVCFLGRLVACLGQCPWPSWVVLGVGQSRPSS